MLKDHGTLTLFNSVLEALLTYAPSANNTNVWFLSF